MHTRPLLEHCIDMGIAKYIVNKNLLLYYSSNLWCDDTLYGNWLSPAKVCPPAIALSLHVDTCWWSYSSASSWHSCPDYHSQQPPAQSDHPWSWHRSEERNIVKWYIYIPTCYPSHVHTHMYAHAHTHTHTPTHTHTYRIVNVPCPGEP